MNFEITNPQGQKFIVSAPEGATQDQVLSYAKQHFEQAAKDRADMERMADPMSGMSGLDKFNTGMGKAFSDTWRGAKQLVGAGPSADEVRETRRLDAPLMKSKAGTSGNIAGNLALMAPAAFVPGASAIPAAGAIGATTAALQPTEGAGERLKNMGIGFGLGSGSQWIAQNPMRAYEGAKSLLSAPFKGAKAVVEPLYQSGQEQIISRALNKAVGGGVSSAARNLESSREIVPGSLPTAAEVSGSGGLAAMQRAASAVAPEEYAARAAANNTARVEALQNIAGSDGRRDFFDAARKQAANELYERAYEKGVDISRDPMSGKFLPKSEIAGVKGEITKLLKRPAIQDAVKDARILAANEGVNLTNPAGSIKGLDYVKRALDDQISAAVPGSNQARVLSDLKGRLLTTVDRLSPDYAQARLTFQEMSKPINQMDIGKEIAEKAINKLTGNLQPQAFARALQDRTAQSATGFNRATLENTMSPEQLGVLGNIKEDLARSVAGQNLGRGVGSDTVQKLAMTNIMQQSGLPTGLLRTPGAGRFANWVYDRTDQEMHQKLARSLLNPQETARLMRLTPTPTPIIEPSAQARNVAGLLSRTAIPSIYMGVQ